jgi:hypothetical protein
VALTGAPKPKEHNYRGVRRWEDLNQIEGIAETKEKKPSPQPKTPDDQIKSPGHIGLKPICPRVRIPAACCFFSFSFSDFHIFFLDFNRFSI